MDDLDHSMHIAEYDWTSFYEDSEECALLQPSLACPDNLSLSDSEDSVNSSSGQLEPRQSAAAISDEAESKAAGCRMERVQIHQSGSGGGQDDVTTKAEEDSETWVKSDMHLNYAEGKNVHTEEVCTRPAGHITEETDDNNTAALQTEHINVQSSYGDSTELNKEDVQTESDTSSIREPDPFCCNQAELCANEPTDRAVSEDVSTVAPREEKERWFVTVNDSPARQRARAKKKRRQKKTCSYNHTCRTPGQEKSHENILELEINRDNNECEGGRDAEDDTQSKQNLVKKSGGQENPESVVSESSQMSLTSGEEDDLSETPITFHITKPTTDGNKYEPSSSASTSDPSRSDSLDSEELGDGVEFFSTDGCDSESYLSAAESSKEPEYHLIENKPLQSLSSLTQNTFHLTENDNDTQDREMHPCHRALSCNVTAPNCEGYESTNDAEPTLTFPSVAQSANKMPDDNSTRDNHTHSTLPLIPSDTPELQKHDINLSASGCSSGHQLSPPLVPDVTVTLCSVADSPETYAQAVGHTQPVYAISAFWDEMEKLTINDILQLRLGRSTPPSDTHDTVTPNVDDFPTNHSSSVDTVEYNLSDGGLIDTSDTADSDYFTQPDESKPDRSSCEFSTSDFEEEYWQFLGASRNPSPDPQSKNKERASDPPPSAREEEESTSSEGRETPVPSEDLAGECLEGQGSNDFISSGLEWPRRITKSKSVYNIQALSTEDLSLQLLPGNDESSLFLSRHPSLEESLDDVVLKASDSLGSLIPDMLDEHIQISFPDVDENFFTDNEAKRDSRCVTVYDPEDISVTPVFDYTLCTFKDQTSDSNERKPIPIFSSSHPTVRELTFPNPDYVFLSADCEMEGDISPIRVVSRSFIQVSDGGTSAAAPRGFWKSLLSMRKICFYDKGSIWCSRSGVWVFPVEAEMGTMKRVDPPMTVVTEGSVASTPSQLFRELAVQQRIMETIQTTRREGIFSTLKQSDMCLVCIAFASWVLKSSDPEAADAWKAALLANVSALSAIQYLRQYVKKKTKNPSQDDP